MLLRKKIVSFVCFTLISDFTFALPMNPVIHDGNVTIRHENNLTEIDSGAFAELHWDDFSIGVDETVRFLQPDATAVAINRVLSATPSSLFGKLESIGQIVLINPNGILVGRDAMINTGSLIASTFDLFEGSRIRKETRFPSSVVNEGSIYTRSGDLILLGEKVANLGSIFSAKSILIGASSDISLSLKEEPKIVFGPNSGRVEIGIENAGTMIARGPDAKIYLESPFAAISHQGSLIAKTDDGWGGEIRILGGANHIHENSLIDVSGPFGGGTVLVGGDYKGQNPSISNSKHTWVAPGSAIFANATDTGNGGKIIFWGNESTYFRGSAEARGGMKSGDGGLIEISSKGKLDTEGRVDLLSPFGKTGMLFLDPSIVTISNAANSGTITAFPPPGYTFSAAMENISNLVATTIQTYLATSDVTIDATASGPGAPGTGSITLNSDGDAPSGMGGIVWAVPTKLTLIADDFITIRNLINNTDITSTVDTVLVDVTAPTVTIGDIATAALGNNAAIIVGSGRVHVQASSALNLFSNSTAATGGIRSGLNAGDMVIGTGSVLIENTGSIEINTLNVGGLRTLIDASENVEIHITGNILQSAGAGGDAVIATRGGGDLSIFGGGDITLNGGSGAGLCRAIIIGFAGGNVLTDISGNYLLQGGTAGGGGDGSAGITFQSGAGTLSVSGVNVVMQSGSGVGTNTAQIGATGLASGPTTVNATGSVTVSAIGGPVGGPKFALLGSFFGGASGDVTINTGDLFVNGSTTPGVVSGQALVGTNGDITVTATGSVNITGGSGASSNGAAILAFLPGNHVSVTANSLQILGGSTLDCFAGIQSLNGPTTIDLVGDCFIQGGSGMGAFAGITSVPAGGTGDLNVSGRNFTIIGGTAVDARAAIAAGDPGMMAGGSGSLFLTSTGASGITLTGGINTEALVSGLATPDSNVTIQTTHLTLNGSTDPGSTNGTASISATGDITIDASGDISLTAGSGVSGNSTTISTSFPGKFIHVTADNIYLTGGSTTNSNAAFLGFQGPVTSNILGDYLFQAGSGPNTSAGMAAALFAGTGDLILSGRNFTLNAGSGLGSLAVILTGNQGGAGGDGSIFITCTGNNGISLNGGSGMSSSAAISTYGSALTNSVNIMGAHPSGNLNMISGTGGEARISTLGGAIDIFMNHDINLVSTPGIPSTIAISGGTSNLTVQAAHSASINSSIVNLGSGDIYFVVDAAFPAPPLFGTGGFNLGAGAFFQTGGGAIRIFTSQQSLNTIDGTFVDAFLTSHAFTAGTLFIDTNQEVWCTYYPSTFGGTPFTIFYKNCLQELATQANLIAAESLADLHPYNEFPGWWERFTMSTTGIDPEHAFSTPYFITHRTLGSIWLPKSYTSYLHDVMD